MKHKCRTIAIAGAGLMLASALAYAAGRWPTLPIVGQPSFCASTVSGVGLPASQGPFGVVPGSTQGTAASICGQTVPAGPPTLTGSELIPADTLLAGGAPPQTVTIPAGLLGNFSGTPRNYLDNGDMAVDQRLVQTTGAVGIVTCAVASAAIASVNYTTDRWGCIANVTSGAGRGLQVATPIPAGFTKSLEVYRTSGILTQPVCAVQEIPTVRSTALAGKTVTLSVYADALAALASDNNSQITLSIIYGTGTDEGLGTFTASPAITPAWAGVGFVVNQQPVTISTSWGRYSVSGAVPAAATEVGVEVCFTPTAAAVAGTTDGFAFTGAQLEVAPSATSFEFLSYGYELQQAQTYFYRINETSSIVPIAMCVSATTSITVCNVKFPQVMRAVPTMTYVDTASNAFQVTAITQDSGTQCVALATSTRLSGSSASTRAVPVSCTSSAAFAAAGSATMLFGGSSSGTGQINASADF